MLLLDLQSVDHFGKYEFWTDDHELYVDNYHREVLSHACNDKKRHQCFQHANLTLSLEHF